MKCEIGQKGGVAVVTLSGDLDLESSSRLRTALLDCVATKAVVLVEMSGVSYIDSSGVGSLVEAYQTARKSSKVFALAAVSEAAMRILELARLDRVFTIHATLADSLRDTG